MRAVAQINDKQVEAMDLDITFRMTVGEWRALMRQTPNTWPASDLGRHIAAVLGHIEKSTAKTFTDPLHAADNS